MAYIVDGGNVKCEFFFFYPLLSRNNSHSRNVFKFNAGSFECVFSDSGQSSHGTSAKGERLSVKLKTLPGSNEPYETSTQQEIGET